MSQFSTDTALQQIADGHFTGQVSPAWNIGTNPNGGYLLSIVMNALARTLAHPDPITVTTHYLRPGVSDAPCDIHVDVLRSGRSVSTARARLVQEGKTRLEVMCTFADLGVSAGVDTEFTVPCPELPPIDVCVPRTGSTQGVNLPISERLEVLLHPDFASPGGSARARMTGYIRIGDGTEPDSRILCMFADAFPPSPFGVLGVVGWVPTIELTVHVRRRPAPGWVWGQFDCEDLTGGRMIESGMLWDSTGALVAQSRQIGLVLNQS